MTRSIYSVITKFSNPTHCPRVSYNTQLLIFLGKILLGGEQGFLLQEASIPSPGKHVYYIVHGVRWLNFSRNSLFRKGLYEDQHTVQIQMAYPAVTQTTITLHVVELVSQVSRSLDPVCQCMLSLWF